MSRTAEHLDRAELIFSEELEPFTATEQRVLLCLLLFFPDPAPFSNLFQVLQDNKKLAKSKNPKRYLESIIPIIRKGLKAHNIPLTIRHTPYGYGISHADFLNSWWSYFNENELAILKVLLTAQSTLLYDDLYKLLFPDQKEPLSRSDLNYIYLVVFRLAKKLDSFTGVKIKKEKTAYSDISLSFTDAGTYTREAMLQDLANVPDRESISST